MQDSEFPSPLVGEVCEMRALNRLSAGEGFAASRM